MLRYRMNRILKSLEHGDEKTVLSLVSSQKYRNAVLVLSDVGAVKVIKSWGGDIVRVILLDHHATYQLERRDVWLNRILGFLFGIGTSVLTALIIGLLPI